MTGTEGDGERQRHSETLERQTGTDRGRRDSRDKKSERETPGDSVTGTERHGERQGQTRQ